MRGLFDDVLPSDDIAGMTRRNDHHTSIDAAAVVVRNRTELHEQILEAFDKHGDMTDEDLERLPEFQSYGPSTIRKRRSELFLVHQVLSVCGDRRNSRGRKMLVWQRSGLDAG